MTLFKNKKIVYLICCIAFFQGSVVIGQTFNIKDFGAVGDGKTDNTEAFARAVDSCAANGGEVYVPSGIFLTGTIELKSGVTLNVSANATILGQTDLKKYPENHANMEFYGEEWARYALIYANRAENIAIKGSGTIDGQGASFPIANDKKPFRYMDRPYLLWFIKCKSVTVEDVSMRNSALWMQYYLACEDVMIDNISVWNHSNKNNDLLDIDGCKNVRITNVTGDSDDDGITLKSTSPHITENVAISNCVISSHCNALKFGTESTGGFRNVVISNCIIKPSESPTLIYGEPAGISGIALEMVDGGVMENISINNIAIDGPEVPLFLRLGNRARKHTQTAKEPSVGRIENIQISNVIATNMGATGCAITGIEGASPFNISLRDLSFSFKGGGEMDDMFKAVPEDEKLYPEPTMFGNLPAYGLFIRHIDGIKISNVTFNAKEKESRPGIIIDDCHRFGISSADIQTDEDTKAVVVVKDSSNGLLTGINHAYPAQNYLWLDSNSKDIEMEKGSLPKVKNELFHEE